MIIDEDYSRVVALQAWGKWWDVVPGTLQHIEHDRIRFTCAHSRRRITTDRYSVRIYAEEEAVEVNPSG